MLYHEGKGNFSGGAVAPYEEWVEGVEEVLLNTRKISHMGEDGLIVESVVEVHGWEKFRGTA